MRRSLAKFSGSEASNHTPSLADFTTTTPELKFSVHTGFFRAETLSAILFQARQRLPTLPTDILGGILLLAGVSRPRLARKLG
jgi:hypothetical protein